MRGFARAVEVLAGNRTRRHGLSHEKAHSRVREWAVYVVQRRPGGSRYRVGFGVSSPWREACLRKSPRRLLAYGVGSVWPGRFGAPSRMRVRIQWSLPQALIPNTAARLRRTLTVFRFPEFQYVAEYGRWLRPCQTLHPARAGHRRKAMRGGCLLRIFVLRQDSHQKQLLIVPDKCIRASKPA